MSAISLPTLAAERVRGWGRSEDTNHGGDWVSEERRKRLDGVGSPCLTRTQCRR